MSHVSPSILIRLAAGDMSPDERPGVEAHLAGCVTCRRVFDDLRATHSRLGEWRIDASGRDTWAAIDSVLDTTANHRPAWAWSRRLSRIAAAIVLGSGVGYGAGWLARSQVASTTGEATAAGADEALAALGFGAIESPSATGLFTVISPDDDPSANSEDTL